MTVEIVDEGGQLAIEKTTYAKNGTDLEEGAVPTFTNRYKAAPVSLSFPVRKIIRGDRPAAFERFVFTLNGSNINEQTVSIAGEGTASFDAITFEATGTYTYAIRELRGGNANYDYDRTVYNVTVVVADAGGRLVIANTTDAAGSDFGTASFTNIYHAPRYIPDGDNRDTNININDPRTPAAQAAAPAPAPTAPVASEAPIDIPVTDVPLADFNEEDMMDIDTIDVPLTDMPEEELIDIDLDVPLSSIPQTGDETAIWTYLAVLSAAGMLFLLIVERKKRQEEND